MLRAWDAVEMTLATSMAHPVLGLAPLLRAATLRADLAAPRRLPRGARRPSAAMGLAEGVGTIYVLEGTALGGPVLAPLVERHLGLPPATAPPSSAGSARAPPAAGPTSRAHRRLGPRLRERRG